MVQINLAPKAATQQGRLEEDLRGFLFVCGLALISAMVIWALMLSVLAVAAMRLHLVDAKWQKVKHTIAEIESLNRTNKALSSKLGVVRGLAEQKFSWSALLSRINIALPPEIWLTQVTSERRVAQKVIFDQPDAAAPAGNPANILTIRGQAVSLRGEEPVGTVGKFLSTLREDKAFSDNFTSINLGPINKGRIGNIDIMQFELFCNFK